jgi:hypothetical protein
VRLVYIDEAGISKKTEEPFLVVAGIIVDADRQLRLLEECLDDIVRRYIPADKQDGFIFHAKELFNGASGGKMFDRHDPHWGLIENRIPIMDELANIPKKFNLPVVFSFSERAKFPATFVMPENTPDKERTITAHMLVYAGCAIDVETWMRRNTEDEVCLMVVEDNDDARRHIKDAQRYLQQPGLIALLDEDEKKYFPFTKIKEDPLFQRKRSSSPLQLADFCAYVIKRKIMNPDDQRISRFFDPLVNQISLIPLSS